MNYIKIQENANGSHSNQSGGTIENEEWAIIPQEIEIPITFPFVDIVVEDGCVTQITAQQLPTAEEIRGFDSETKIGIASKLMFYKTLGIITEEEYNALIVETEGNENDE